MVFGSLGSSANQVLILIGLWRGLQPKPRLPAQ